MIRYDITWLKPSLPHSLPSWLSTANRYLTLAVRNRKETKTKNNKSRFSMLEYRHNAKLWQSWQTTMMLSTAGTGTSPTEHRHCCSQCCWQLQCQKVHAAGAVCRTGTDNHRLTVPAEGQIQDDLATPILQTLTPLGLCPWAPKGPVGHATHQSHAQSGLQPRPQAGSDQSPTQYQACCEEKRSIGEEAWHQQAASEKYWVLKGAPG